VRDDDVDVAAVKELRAPAGADGTGLGEDETVAALRAEFDLPDELGDSTAERAVGEALSALAAGDREAAVAALDETFTTPCETHAPSRQPVAGSRDHEVACLLRHPPEGVAPGREARADDD
jgi:peptide/nickel transport system ATP-binding protein